MGDFNSITSQSEKKCGIPFLSSTKYSLSDDLNNLSLIDIGFSGNSYTWNNKRKCLANIPERLDRGVANSYWCTIFPHASILHLPVIASDHSPLLLNTYITTKGGHTPFKFEAMRLSDESCHDTVYNGWNQTVNGSPSFKLHSRIKNERFALKEWNKSHFGHC